MTNNPAPHVEPTDGGTPTDSATIPGPAVVSSQARDDTAPPSAQELPIRQKSANGEPKPIGSYDRRCKRCKASFIKLAPGKTGERGIWKNWQWYCSQECADA